MSPIAAFVRWCALFACAFVTLSFLYFAVNQTSTASQNQVNSIAITVAGANGKTLTVTPGGGTFGGDAVAVADEWQCTGGAVTPVRAASAPAVVLNADPDTITCVPADSTNAHATASRYYEDLDTLDMDVS